MLKYQVTAEGKDIEVWLETDDLNEQVAIKYSGESKFFQDWLETSRGAFGHIIGNATTLIDLNYVLNTPESKQFKPKIIEGSIESYDPKIPKDAIT